MLFTACGTYSVLRPADNLEAGRVEITGGLTANTIPEVLPVMKGNVGLTDWLEIGAQYEVYTLLGEARFGLLSSEAHGIALALGAQGGMVSRYTGSTGFADATTEFAAGPTLTVGRRWDIWEIYLGGKALSNFESSGFGIVSGKLGARVILIPTLFLGAEAGVSGHFWGGSGVAVGEGTLSLGIRL